MHNAGMDGKSHNPPQTPVPGSRQTTNNFLFHQANAFIVKSQSGPIPRSARRKAARELAKRIARKARGLT